MKVYNTASKQKEEFKPLKSKRVNLFVCGPTVYDFSHIGHAKLYIFFDAFVKFLRQKGYKVFYLQNITDIDDKIIFRAKERGVAPKDLAIAFEKEYLKDMKALRVTAVSKYAGATDYIKEIISQAQRLLDKGFAYKLEDGIYFDISKFENYGKLSGRTVLQAEDAVSRVDYSKNKRNRGDFCLWKFSEAPEPGWESPLGFGRPGWHIEDTAITEKFFGAQYDAHGGAIELIFPHHEAEVAQMEAVSGRRPLVKYWMHVGFLTVNGQKMAKSTGNYITISDFIKRRPYQQLRFLVLKNLWRSPIDYSESSMIEIKSALERVEEFLRKIKYAQLAKKNAKAPVSIKNFKTRFFAELEDDFNTPKAFAVMFDFIKEMNVHLAEGGIGKKESTQILDIFKQINKIFEIFDFKNLKKPVIPAQVKKLAKEREQARKDKDWAKSDQLRAQIEKQGYKVEDTAKGPVLTPV